MNKDILNVIVESVSQVYEHRAVTDRWGQFLQEIHRRCVINSKGTSSLVNGLPVESPQQRERWFGIWKEQHLSFKTKCS